MRITLITIFSLCYVFCYGQIEFNFGKNKNGVDWVVVNDGVMGGLSTGQLQFTKKSLIFKGAISLKNNGGFASFRNQYGSYNLQQISTVEIKYRSIGQAMALSLEPNDLFYKPTYRVLLNDTNFNWETKKISINDFFECILGEPTGDSITSDILGKIKRIGFITAEKKEVNFKIEIQYLKFK